MSIWRQPTTPEAIQARRGESVNTLLDIVITEIGPDFVKGEMPVDGRHVQPFGIIHGGVSVVLAETLGSLASLMACDPGFHAVGLEVNANHLRPLPKGGRAYGLCTPVRIGRSVHVWNIELRRDDGELTCVSRLTTAILERKASA
ncbi:hotdog fold thioesterase [Roseococcus sp. SYP-B2431]|uniref:PaaI family thioesterase n=1 Tax=Roseococcus sp. SYP-B2431 TaxID=2496640 RepID=UPI00103B5280|nr:hotdog fold thioesterase [Roseococcus sp. SYP-B2431]TCH96791.1 hotdog fold thioesterase [Roseococcus sp. SYP-B2431]